MTYYTSILLAHHSLKKFELDEDYLGNETATGEHFNVEEGNGPFRAFIEVGLMKITTSNVKVCGALMVH
jgi:large subunit ribosomal protein L5e